LRRPLRLYATGSPGGGSPTRGGGSAARGSRGRTLGARGPSPDCLPGSGGRGGRDGLWGCGCRHVRALLELSWRCRSDRLSGRWRLRAAWIRLADLRVSAGVPWLRGARAGSLRVRGRALLRRRRCESRPCQGRAQQSCAYHGGDQMRPREGRSNRHQFPYWPTDALDGRWTEPRCRLLRQKSRTMRDSASLSGPYEARSSG
jgi:hypothetical protein